MEPVQAPLSLEQRVQLQQLLERCAFIFGVPASDIMAERAKRQPRTNEAMWCMYHVLYDIKSWDMVDVARATGRDHSTVSVGLKTARLHLAGDIVFKRNVGYVLGLLSRCAVIDCTEPDVDPQPCEVEIKDGGAMSIMLCLRHRYWVERKV